AFGRADDIVPLAAAGRDGEKGGNPRLAGPREHRPLLLDEAGGVQVAVAVDKHHSPPSTSSRRGKPGVGFSTRTSAISVSSAPKSRAAAGMHSASRILVEAVGVTGEMATARSRMAPHKVASTRSIRAGSVLRSAHGACSSM